MKTLERKCVGKELLIAERELKTEGWIITQLIHDHTEGNSAWILKYYKPELREGQAELF